MNDAGFFFRIPSSDELIELDFDLVPPAPDDDE